MKAFKFVLISVLYCSFLAHGQQDNFTQQSFSNLQFAHRGGYHDLPENIVPTFLINYRRGVTAFETDVMLTADGELILFHDKTCERLLDTSAINLSDLTLHQIKRLQLKNKSLGEQYVSTLKELLDSLMPLTTRTSNLLLELDFKISGKDIPEATKMLVNLLNDYYSKGFNIYNHVFVSTYYPAVLKALKRLNPDIHTAFAVINNPTVSRFSARLAIWLSPLIFKRQKSTIIQPSKCMISWRYVKRWLKRGAIISTYTVNSSCEKEYIEQFNIAYNSDCPSGTCQVENNAGIGKPKKRCKTCAQ